MSSFSNVTLNLKLFYILIAINHCYILWINKNILPMQVNNANILKTIGMLYNTILLSRQNTMIQW